MGRIFAIADIHGCCRTFQQLLFNVIHLQKEDTLHLLGDYIDRGPNSKGVIDTIIGLQRDGYDVRPVMGNHESLLIKFIESGLYDDLCAWLDIGGWATLKSYGVEHPEDIPVEHLSFIKDLPLCFTTETHVFVHAGLNFCLFDPLNETSQKFMLWSRINRGVEPDKIGGRIVIAGHTVRSINVIVESLKSDFIQLDNGCYMGGAFQGKGNLVALELSTGELFVQENIDH